MINIKRRIKNKKPLILRVHTRPDSDIFLTFAYLKMHGANVDVENIIFNKISGGIASHIKFKNNKKEVIHVDILHEEFDHHGKKNKTSLHMMAEELGNEEWLEPVLSCLLKIDSYGESLFADIGNIGKALVHAGISDNEILEIGSEAARLILEFHKQGLKRDNKRTKGIIEKFFINKEMSKSFKKYTEHLNNERFQRSCDLCEIISAKSLEDEKEAEKFGLTLISYLYKDYIEYQKGTEEAKTSLKVKIEGSEDFVAVVKECTSPKTHTVLIGQGALSVIQKNQGNIQIFFNNKRVSKEATDVIILRLRKIERILSGETAKLSREILIKPEVIIACPQWYYFLGEIRKSKQRGIFIFNGSLTTPDVPPTKIPFDGIISVVVLTFKEVADQIKKFQFKKR